MDTPEHRLLIGETVQSPVDSWVRFAASDMGWTWAGIEPDYFGPEVREFAAAIVQMPMSQSRLDRYFQSFLPPFGMGMAIISPRMEGPQTWYGSGSVVWIDAALSRSALDQEVRAWLRGLLGAGSVDGTVRGQVEALYREVQLGLVENEYLRALITELTSQLAGARERLSDAQLEIRTLEALHAQLEKQNEALLKELSKGRVQPESASLLARGIKFGAVSLVSLAITVGGTYAGTRAALPDDQVAQLQVIQQTIVDHCDQVIDLPGDG